MWAVLSFPFKVQGWKDIEPQLIEPCSFNSSNIHLIGKITGIGGLLYNPLKIRKSALLNPELWTLNRLTQEYIKYFRFLCSYLSAFLIFFYFSQHTTDNKQLTLPICLRSLNSCLKTRFCLIPLLQRIPEPSPHERPNCPRVTINLSPKNRVCTKKAIVMGDFPSTRHHIVYTTVCSVIKVKGMT